MNRSLNNIIYAEDEDDIRMIAQIALEDIGGFNIKFCKNGAEVLQTTQSFTPDLFILDVMMPSMDGPTTLKEIRKIPSMINIPAIFMTAKIQSDEIDEYKKMGVIEIISKPFDPMRLSDLVREIWNKHQEGNYEQ